MQTNKPPKTQRRVYLDFVGCRLNQAEIERLAREFVAQGDSLAQDATEADLIVINTCAVTREAARKSRQLIRQAARANPDAHIIATGCDAELEPAKLTGLPNVACVIGNQHKDRLVALLSDGDTPCYEKAPLLREPLPPGTLGRTRAFVKVQDGCNNHCTFCITTTLRGEGRSRPAAEIVQELNRLVACSYREVVLTGVHLGSYGQDDGSADVPSLAGLLETLLAQTRIPRLRLSSLEPWDIPPGFFDLWHDPRLCLHLHLPLQSGCDATLRRMARRTTQQSFAALAEAARAHIPDLALTTDLMVGFPGETESDFEESLRYVEQIGFARLHVFTYSQRPGTPAARMPGQVPLSVKRARQKRAQALSDRLWKDFQAQRIGRTYEVLWESAHATTPEGFVWSGLTGNYLRVLTTSPRNLANTITSVRLDKLTGAGLLAVSL